jgi:flagellar basal body-associated protein FliL
LQDKKHSTDNHKNGNMVVVVAVIVVVVAVVGVVVIVVVIAVYSCKGQEDNCGSTHL